MDEQGWLNSNDLAAMLSALPQILRCDDEQMPAGAGVSDRKLRLFGCACCLQLWGVFTEDRTRLALNAIAALDPPWDRETAAKVRRLASTADDGYGACVRNLHREPAIAAENAAFYARQVEGQAAVQAALLREIVGNPFRRVLFRCQCTTLRHFPDGCEMCEGDKVLPHPRYEPWLTPLILQMAQMIYEDRSWGDLPILADALEDAGCDPVCRECNGWRGMTWGMVDPRWKDCETCLGTGKSNVSAILEHLRSPESHVRGCWALDLLLGKE